MGKEAGQMGKKTRKKTDIDFAGDSSAKQLSDTYLALESLQKFRNNVLAYRKQYSKQIDMYERAVKQAIKRHL